MVSSFLQLLRELHPWAGSATLELPHGSPVIFIILFVWRQYAPIHPRIDECGSGHDEPHESFGIILLGAPRLAMDYGIHKRIVQRCRMLAFRCFGIDSERHFLLGRLIFFPHLLFDPLLPQSLIDRFGRYPVLSGIRARHYRPYRVPAAFAALIDLLCFVAGSTMFAHP